jgi:hypothetical protein
MKTFVAALTSLSLLSVWSVGVSAATLPSNLTGLTASQIANLSLTSAQVKGSCTNVSVGKATGFTFGSSTDSGRLDAQEELTINKATGVVRLVKGALFTKESQQIIRLQFGISDSKYANKWISIPRSSKHYVPFSSGLTFDSMIAQVRPSGKLTESKVGTLHGVKVIAINGSPNAELGLTTGAETLFVSDTSPYLPVEIAASGRSQGVPTTLVVTFSNWGRSVTYATPAGAIPISSTDLP